MSRSANPARGEAMIMVGGAPLLLRPSFAALIEAEAELGPLFGLVERAAEGQLGIGEMASLFFHCAAERPDGVTRERIGQAIAETGLARAAPALRVLLGQILQGRV
ncbi:MAG TPA: gene transfer agent family protein [Allosphingosinicella sp.]|nr:gene transfer agent family protein [Allosphingosinicella sp.]